jgi:hypothetical protein
MRLEQQLRRALERKDPPSDFDDRVLSRIAAGETVRMSPARRQWSRWSRASLPLAASVLIAFGATYYVQHEQERRAREQQAQTVQAAHDVVLALQIASEKISAAQAKVEEITRYDPTNSR